MASFALKIAAAVFVIIVAVAGVYAALTFPREIVGFQVSFTAGVDREQKKL